MHDDNPHANIHCWNCRRRLVGVVTVDRGSGKSFCCVRCMKEFGEEVVEVSDPPVRGNMPRTGGSS